MGNSPECRKRLHGQQAPKSNARTRDSTDSRRTVAPRKTAGEAFAESDAALRSIYESSPVLMGVVELTADNDIIHVYDNPATARFFGVEYRSTENQTASKLGAPREAIQTWVAHYRQSQRCGRPVRFEYLHPKTACVAWLSVTVAPIGPGVSGRMRFSYVAEDVTAAKRREEVLQASESRYRSLIETTGTGYVIIDEEGRVLEANAEYVRLAGHRDLNEIRGQSVLEWTADHAKAQNAQAVQQCIRKGTIRNLEIDYVDSRGQVTPVDINATVVRIGGHPHILTLCRDITERRRMEVAVRESEEKFRTIFENAVDGIMAADPATLAIPLANRRMADMLGYSVDELLRLRVPDLHTEESLPEVLLTFQRMLRRELPFVDAVPFKRKDGTVFYSSISVKDMVLGG
ncbi:MAG: PAS domain S-box protein, partial [Chloroflexota bacterium]